MAIYRGDGGAGVANPTYETAVIPSQTGNSGKYLTTDGSNTSWGFLSGTGTGSVVFTGAAGTYTENNANFFWDNTNSRLGIGTASPTNPLTVSATSTRNTPLTTIQSVGAFGGGSGFDVGLLVDISAFAASTSALNVKSASTSRLWVGTDGNVGIGTSSPTYKLDVQQNSAANNFPLRVSNSDTGATSGAAIAVTQGVVTGFFQAYGNNTVYFGSQTNHPLVISTNSAERMRIHASGGVSIGNTTDSGLASLNVSGSISGGYIAHADGTTAMAFGADNVVRVTPNATATYTTTVPAAGAICVLSILTSGTTSRTITFGTGFKSTGTLATGTTSARYFNITFVSDGTNLIEMSRTTAIA